MAKLMTQRDVLEIADQSLQIHDGYVYMRHTASSTPSTAPA